MTTQTKSFFKALFTKNILCVFLLGFASGLPLLLTGGTLKLWLTREGIDIKTIGYLGWVGMAYSLKFLWSPLVDRYALTSLGRRRSWIILTQILIAGFLMALAQQNPKFNLNFIIFFALGIAFLSATQDVAIDAYRREILKDEEQGLGSSFSSYGYRIAMLLSGGVGIGLVGSSTFNLTWGGLYVLMALLLLSCALLTWWMPEPEASKDIPKTFFSAVVDPFREFLKKEQAIIILLFVLFFKLGDALSGAMLNPYYAKMGYSNADIGLIAKTIGLSASMLGLFLGGLILYRWNLIRSLWLFGILQALSTAGFALITYTGPKLWALGFAVIFEDISAGMGNAAFVAYMSSITHRKFTGTQYALLSSVATLGRNFFSGFSGKMVEVLGWAHFFYACALIAIPGMVLLRYLRSPSSELGLDSSGSKSSVGGS